MLEEHGVEYNYREYTKEPLSASEIKDVLKALGLKAKDVVRKNDKAFKEQGLTGEETNTQLVRLMAQFPTLLQRPIGWLGSRAVVGRPVENLLDLLG